MSCYCKYPVALPDCAEGRSAVCDCGISLSFSLTFCYHISSYTCIQYKGRTLRKSMTFIMLKNVKMPTFVGILTFISMVDITSASLKARKVFLFQHFSFRLS